MRSNSRLSRVVELFEGFSAALGGGAPIPALIPPVSTDSAELAHNRRDEPLPRATGRYHAQDSGQEGCE